MIAFLFATVSASMLLAYFGNVKISYVVFTISILLGTYWLKFHSTTPLTIQL